jgi:hypothetical protein
MNDYITLWQVVAAYAFALVGGWISTTLQLAHKQLCALISFAAGTLLGVTIFAILPESFGACSWWAVFLGLYAPLARPVISTQMPRGISAKSLLR